MKPEDLPEHLKEQNLIAIKPWHFWMNKKSREKKLTLSDNFVDEVMRAQDLRFEPEIEGVVKNPGEKPMVIAKVTVWKENEIQNETVAGLAILRKTTAFASVNEMPHSGGQSHYAQLAITRALKTAVIRHLQISDHDVEILIEAYGIDTKHVETATRDVSADEDEQDTKEPEVIEPEIDLGLEL